MSYWLDSAVERNRRFPTFEIPSEQERSSLRVGDHAKLLFSFKRKKGGLQGEKMWVQITDVGANAYRGTLANKPATIKVLKPGDQIDFLPLHVAAIKRGEKAAEEKAIQQDLFAPKGRRP